jgi:hypothetical protein
LALFGVANGLPTARAADAGPSLGQQPTILFFSGGDVWGHGAFGHAGLLWSPGGLDTSGFTLKVFGSGGRYDYLAGALGGVEVTGRQLMAAALPGWRFKNEDWIVTVFAGLELQDHKLTPDDPGNKLRGTNFGVSTSVDVWYQPRPDMMVSASGSLNDKLYYSLRTAFGGLVLDRFFFGPEAQTFGGDDYWQFRFGLQATGLKLGPFEWSLGAGWAEDSDGRGGPYGYLGVLARR